MNIVDIEKYIKALEFAAKAHEGQFITGTDRPYILHPVRVSMEIIDAAQYLPDIDITLAAVAALLHDVIEDTPVGYGAVFSLAGKAAADGVIALTKNKHLPSGERMADSLARIALQTLEISIVKLADRITNMERPPDSWEKEKRKKYADEADVILEKLGGASEYLASKLAEKIKFYRDNYIDPAPEKKESGGFIRIDGFAGKIFTPLVNPDALKKHPCADCHSCQFCSDERCALCLGGK